MGQTHSTGFPDDNPRKWSALFHNDDSVQMIHRKEFCMPIVERDLPS
jgi:hypothetical protein